MNKIIIIIAIILLFTVIYFIFKKSKNPKPPNPYPNPEPIPPEPVESNFEILPSGDYKLLTSKTITMSIDCIDKTNFDDYSLCSLGGIRLDSNQSIPLIHFDSDIGIITINYNNQIYYLSNIHYLGSNISWIDVKNSSDKIQNRITKIFLARHIKENKFYVIKYNLNDKTYDYLYSLDDIIKI